MAIGYIKWFDPKKGFGFIETKDGDIFFHCSHVVNFREQVVPDAEVEFEYTTIYDDGAYKPTVTEVLAVTPPSVVEVLDTVKFFNTEKGFGFVHTDLGRDAYLHISVCKKAGITPKSPGMPMRALVEKRRDKLTVISFTWGEQVEEDYRKLHGVTEVNELLAEMPTALELDTPVAANEPTLETKTKSKPKKATTKKSATTAKSVKLSSPRKATSTKVARATKSDTKGVDLNQLIASGKGNGSFGEQLRAAVAK